VGGGGGGGRRALFGDLLCLISAACQCVVIVNRCQIKKYVPLWQYSAATTTIVAFSSSFLYLLVDGKGPSYIFCNDMECIYGWTSHLWLSRMLFFAFVVAACVVGYNYAVQFVSPLVFSSVILVDPALSGMFAWLAGLEGIPPLLTWIGGVVVIGGVAAITRGEYSRERGEESLVKPVIVGGSPAAEGINEEAAMELEMALGKKDDDGGCTVLFQEEVVGDTSYFSEDDTLRELDRVVDLYGEEGYDAEEEELEEAGVAAGGGSENNKASIAQRLRWKLRRRGKGGGYVRTECSDEQDWEGELTEISGLATTTEPTY
jgi:hypothetical protein